MNHFTKILKYKKWIEKLVSKVMQWNYYKTRAKCKEKSIILFQINYHNNA